RLHVAGLVVLAHIGTVVVRPLEDDQLAALIGETRALAGRGVDGERRRRLADLGDGCRPCGRRDAPEREGGEPCERRARDNCSTGRVVRGHPLSFLSADDHILSIASMTAPSVKICGSKVGAVLGGPGGYRA